MRKFTCISTVTLLTLSLPYFTQTMRRNFERPRLFPFSLFRIRTVARYLLDNSSDVKKPISSLTSVAAGNLAWNLITATFLTPRNEKEIIEIRHGLSYNFIYRNSILFSVSILKYTYLYERREIDSNRIVFSQDCLHRIRTVRFVYISERGDYITCQ